MSKFSPTEHIAKAYHMNGGTCRNLLLKLKVKPKRAIKTAQQLRYEWDFTEACRALELHFAEVEGRNEPSPAATPAPAPTMERITNEHIANVLVELERKIDALAAQVNVLTFVHTPPAPPPYVSPWGTGTPAWKPHSSPTGTFDNVGEK